MANRKNLVGELVDDYSVVAELGSGSYGTVYQANELKPPHRRVALKLMHEAYLGSQERFDSFSKEAQMLKQLKHDYILPILHEGAYGGFPYMVTAYAPNGSLRNRLLRELGQPLPIREALIILWQIGQALDYLHEQNFLHLDLKPENILFDSQGHALLADFSIATVRSTTGTQPVDVVGTATYMSPEQFRGNASKWSDQYALGCIAYELYTGRPPFDALDFVALGFMHVSDPPVPLRQYNPQLPPYIEQAVLKAMSKQRDNRYSTILDFITALYPPTVYVPDASSPPLTIAPTEEITVKDEIELSRKQERDLFEQGHYSEVQEAEEEQAHQAEEGRYPRVEEAEQKQKITELPPQVVTMSSTDPPLSLSPTDEVLRAKSTTPIVDEQQPAMSLSQAGSGSASPPQAKLAHLAEEEQVHKAVAPVPVNQTLLTPENLSVPSSLAPNQAAPTQPMEMPTRGISRRATLVGIAALAGAATVGGGWYALTHPSTLGTTSASSSNPSGLVSTKPLTIKIATDFPVSGNDMNAGGKTAENGAHLAVDQANAQKLVSNVTFAFVPKDDVGPSGAHDPATGQKNVADLISDALVAGMVGPFNSSVAQAELPEANQANFPIISPTNTNDCLTQTEPAFECGGANSKITTYRPTGKVTYFRIATRDQFQGTALADFAYKTKGWKSAYVIDDTETYGVAIASSIIAEWTKLGGTLLGRSSIAPTTTYYVDWLTQIATKNPDVIFFGGNDSTGGILIRQQMMSVPALKNTPLLGDDGIQTSAMATTIGAYKADGSNGGPVFSSVASINLSVLPSAQKFLADYASVYGANAIGAYSAGSYDCAMVIIQAVKTALDKGVKAPANSGDTAQAKAFRQAVIDAIQGISYDGVTGHIGFDQNGDTTSRIISIYTIADNPNQGDGWTFVTQINT
jgi:branched-chain amino acid transport system substrate-binding protein